jgi:transcriptional regulator with XRE-family HTH domain
MPPADLDWSLLLTLLRTLRGWSQEELSTASGISTSAISKQEVGAVPGIGGSREKLEEALGVAGWTHEIELFLAPLRATMIDPERRDAIRGIEGASSAALQITQAALSLAVEDLRRTDEGSERRPPLEWPVLLIALRLLRGWRQDELAAASGMSEAAISRQERGLQTPTRTARAKLEEALGVRGKTRAIEILLGQIRARMIDPQDRHTRLGIVASGHAAARITDAALRLGREKMRKP